MPYATRSYYLKIRDRNSYAFALVSAAAVVDLDESQTFRHVHIALGGIAHKPWRATKAESFLVGKKLDPGYLRTAADEELRAAKPHRDNAFKVELAKRAIMRAVMTASRAA